MNIRFLEESVMLRDNTESVNNIFSSFGVVLMRNRNYSPNLSDGKPGKYFISRFRDEDGDEVDVLCFSFSARFVLALDKNKSILNNFIQMNYRYPEKSDKVFHLQYLSFNTPRILVKDFGVAVKSEDAAGGRIYANFVRNLVRKVSACSSIPTMYDYIMRVYTERRGYEWGKG